MNTYPLIRLARWFAPLLVGIALAAPAMASTLSISQTPLFITISLPPNITVVLDDSGSMASAFVPDTLDDATTLTVFVTIPSSQGSTSASVVVATGTVNSGTVTSTSSPLSTSVTVATGTVNFGTVTSSCGHTSHGVCTSYNYSCSSGFTRVGPSSGSTATPSSTTCQQQTYNYSCPTGYTLNPSSPTSGTSSTASGYTCTQAHYTYSCASGYTLNGSSSGSTSTPPSGTTCTQQTYNYSCPSGYTLSGQTTGTSSTGSSTTCTTSTPSYVCPSGWTQVGGTGSTSTCTNYLSKSIQGETSPMFASAAYNPLAYDPTITYSLPYDANGNNLSTSFTAAYLNGYDTALGSVNLSTGYKVVVSYSPSSSSQTTTSCGGTFTATSSTGSLTCVSVGSSGTAAYYYLYNASNSGCPTSNPTKDARCYTKVTVSSTSGTGGTDERQNFANWYSFYRTRNLTTVSGADRAFTGLSVNMRVAWLDLGSCTAFASSGCYGWDSSSPSGGYDNRIATFSGTHRQNFFNWLSRLPANVSTPLRTALKTAGTYYTTSGVNSPYAFNPQVTDSPEYVCRPNYTVMMTDGLWNSDTITTFNNQDNTAKTLPDGTAFATNTHPYSDSNSNSLADIAFYYWATNLRSDLGTSTALQYMPFTKSVQVVDDTNKTVSVIPYWNPQNDPASWPHMVTFTVGLGMTTTITNPAWGGSTYSGGYNDLVTGTTAWGTVASDSANNIYDLWHAALNSRGQFFSADSPQDVTTAFTQIVNRIQGRVGSSSAIAVNSTRLDSDTFIYQAQFNSASWTGEVLAFPINSDGSIGAQAWQASTQIPAANSRSIFSWDDTLNSGAGGGISFLWSSLNSTEQANLNTSYSGTTDTQGSNRLDYLRGDQSNEETSSGTFRSRSSLLGDIVNSNPQFVGKQDFGYDKIPGEGSSYDSFVAGKASRVSMLYVGANDGMMHAINADTGVEVFDYVPRGVYGNLSALTDPAYTHQYYVDGSATGVDVYRNGSWATLLVGTTGAGAREIYLLDVTDPSSFSTSDVIWDYDGATVGDNDMGYTLGAATFARLNDGDWYVIFGNGYNSPNQHAVIYLYNLRTKTIRKFDTLVGSSSLNNGMSALNPIDYNNDRVVDALYGGDLQGNLWKLDVSSTDNTQWGFTFSSSGSPAPLFTAKDASGNVQPITDRPQVGLNSSGQEMVFFGTGTYFLTGDNTVATTPPTMSFYGIVDDKGNTSSDQVLRSNLLQQSIVTETTVSGTSFRVTTAYKMASGNQGWYVDLNYPTAQGERVVSDAVLDNGRVIFTTLIPQGNACQFGGISWLMELNFDDGGQLDESPYDINGDGKVNSNDYVTVTYTDPKSGKSTTATVPVSGKESNVGIIKTPGIIRGATLEYKYYSGSTGAIGMTTESVKNGGSRLSWQQLQ